MDGDELAKGGKDERQLTLTPEVLTSVAEYFKVLAEPSRLQILCQLRSGPKNVTQILEATGMGQANVSKHLKILAQAGIVSREPKGVSVYYQIADPVCFELCEVVCKQLIKRLKQQAQQWEPLAALHSSRLSREGS
ncbi:ArsR/SmtB family transcription factor [Synechococcus sp. W70.1]|jgi:DNA-binding transcriptional ArsR family regulator|uniref:ArsR/SmtB family transcription factor n=1 Tax=unclassified Synechococcus TaxID=2626047 RepID=UPI0039C37337